MIGLYVIHIGLWTPDRPRPLVAQSKLLVNNKISGAVKVLRCESLCQCVWLYGRRLAITIADERPVVQAIHQHCHPHHGAIIMRFMPLLRPSPNTLSMITQERRRLTHSGTTQHIAMSSTEPPIMSVESASVGTLEEVTLLSRQQSTASADSDVTILSGACRVLALVNGRDLQVTDRSCDWAVFQQHTR